MYSFFYFPIVTLLKLSLIIAVVNKFKRVVSPLLAFYVSILYLLGMYRSDGIDISSYRRNYDHIDTGDIVDLGYNLLMFLSKSVGLPFESFLLTIGILNLLLIWFICLRLNLSFGIVLSILVLHLFLVITLQLRSLSPYSNRFGANEIPNPLHLFLGGISIRTNQ